MARLTLTSKLEAFLVRMKETDEFARHGYNLLLKRPDFERFFDALRDAGLFDSIRNPEPVPAEEEGYFRIPYWSALDYLLACAKRSDETRNLELASKVLKVVRDVSASYSSKAQSMENYHTAHKFTEILGHLPTSIVLPSDIELIGQWLRSRFNRGLVSSELSELLIPRFLRSEERSDWQKATLILEQCTKVEFANKESSNEEEAKLLVDDYYLQRLVSNYAKLFGAKQPIEAAKVFVQRIREVYRSELHQESSVTFRPAIENDSQNHSFRAAENVMVEGLRDVLLGAAESAPLTIGPLVTELLSDQLQILRRIIIYVINERWEDFGRLYPDLLRSEPFSSGHLHELYRLLSSHFSDMNVALQGQTVAAIKAIRPPTWSDEPELDLLRIKFRWLSAIARKGNVEADCLFEELAADPRIGPLPEHVDYNSYMTSWVGPGPSAYSASELIAFAENKSLPAVLNAYVPSNRFRGPTIEGLATELESAARNQASVFLRSREDLLELKPYFQHSVITGLKAAWESKQSNFPESEWKAFLEFFEWLIGLPEPSDQEDKRYRNWVLTSVAESIEVGTRDDGHAFSPSLFDRAGNLLSQLLRIAESAPEYSDDPMMQALNTPKGRTISALFSFALRSCRVGDQTAGSHEREWSKVSQLFDSEISKCKNANYEFSTQSAANLAQLQYLNSDWVLQNFPALFPKEFPANDMCALAGLAYASFTKSIYAHLLSVSAIDRALEYKTLPGAQTKVKLLERVTAAYLWGVEELDSPRITRIFADGRAEDLQHISWVIWTIRSKDVSEHQKQLIKAFWWRCLAWASAQPSTPKQLLSALASLSVFLDDAQGSNLDLLKRVAPYVYAGHDAYEFFEQLERLAEVSAENVCSLLETMVAAHAPEYDYQDHLLKTLKVLVAKGLKNRVLLLLEELRSLTEMRNYFHELSPRG